jgi:hypothetical protein
MVNANIEIFEMPYEDYDSHFKGLENLEKIKRTNSPCPAILTVENKERVSGASSVGKSSKNHNASNMWCHYCDKNSNRMADCREIENFKQRKKSCFEAKDGSGKKSLVISFLFKEIKNCKQKKEQKERLNFSCFFSTEIKLTT